MMSMELWVVFVMTSGAATLLPGPSVLLALHNGLVHSRKQCIAGAAGVVTAALLLGSVAMTGLVGLLMASAVVFRTLRLVGAAYLIYLGARMLWSARDGFPGSLEEQRPKTDERSLGKLFRQGLGVGMSNPKAILFFAALFPQFIDASRSGVMQYAVILVTLAGVVFTCLMVYSLGGRWLARRWQNRLFARWTGRFTGATYIVLGGCCAFSRSS